MMLRLLNTNILSESKWLGSITYQGGSVRHAELSPRVSLLRRITILMAQRDEKSEEIFDIPNLHLNCDQFIYSHN
jgi:hypothetical protein